MNVYYKNEKASISCQQTAARSSIQNIYDPALELKTEFNNTSATITGSYTSARAINALCLGLTNAYSYVFETREGVFTGLIRGRITIHDFDTLFTDFFTLSLEGTNDALYLGHLFAGLSTELPRFGTEPQDNKALNSILMRGFGGQSFGLRRKSLKSFAVGYPRISNEEKILIDEYVEAVSNFEPHVIDPYPKARDEYPPIYATVDTDEINFTKRQEAGFYWKGSLAWKEAR